VHHRTHICEQVPTKYLPELKYGYHRECVNATTFLRLHMGRINYTPSPRNL